MEPHERFRDGGELSAALEELAMRHPWSASDAHKAWQNQRSKSDRPPAAQPDASAEHRRAQVD
jgi:hypothetical protein